MSWTVGIGNSPVNSRKTGRKVLPGLLRFSLLLLGSQEQMSDQMELLSQKKRIGLSEF